MKRFNIIFYIYTSLEQRLKWAISEGKLQFKKLFEMLILNKEKKPMKVKKTWFDQLKSTLIAKNHAFIKKHQNAPSSPPSIKIQSIFPPNKQIKEIHNYNFKRINHTTFSQYIPISQNKTIKNQLTNYFPYLAHLEETDREQYQNQIYYISQKIVDNNCYGQWRQISRRYLTGLNLKEMIEYYYLLLSKGTDVLNELRNMSNPQCLIGAFFLKVMEVQKLINGPKDNIKNTAITIQMKDDINLQNLTKTYKFLMCPICCIYDCQVHCLPDNALQNKCQYIPSRHYNKKIEQKKLSAMNLIKKMLSFYNKNKDDSIDEQVQCCSEKCYKRFNYQSWTDQINLNNKNYSFFFQTMIKMGIQMYNFNPCKIKLILKDISLSNTNKKIEKSTKINQDVECQQIFTYFIYHYNLLQKINMKFVQSQLQYILKEPKYISDTKLIKKNNLKKPHHIKDKHTRHLHNHKSICTHYFLDKDPIDQSCLNCICTTRGYCLPDCLCSRDYCNIPLRGCKCTADSTCWENKCVCFMNSRVCTSQTCFGCFDCKDSKKYNCCQNNQANFCSDKLTKIGLSSIPNAGLGLFSAQFIPKGQFIIRYVGQLVTSPNLQKIRQNLVANNLFYNFQLNSQSSIDSRLYGNKSRFINHSKKHANVIPRKVLIRQEEIIIFYAIKNIFEGQQILFNYNGQGSLDQFKEKYPFIDQ